MANGNSNVSLNNSDSPRFDPDNDKRFSCNSAYMNIVRINGMGDALEDHIEDMLFSNLNSEVYMQLHHALAMARMCKSLSGELLEYSGNIVVTPSKEALHG